MPLIPAFELGLWNAWIFILYNFLHMPLLMLILQIVSRRQSKPWKKALSVT